MRLVCDGRDVAPLELAETVGARMRGLLGRDGIDGALLLRPANNVHTVGLRFPIDVAYVDPDLQVLHTATMVPHRLALPVWGARSVLEAEAGAFSRWGLREGSRLELRGGDGAGRGRA